jgi:hypothetical protein
VKGIFPKYALQRGGHSSLAWHHLLRAAGTNLALRVLVRHGRQETRADHTMIELILTACSIVQGASCFERKLSLTEETLMSCMVASQVEGARLVEKNPNYYIQRMTCRSTRAESNNRGVPDQAAARFPAEQELREPDDG